MAQSARVFGAGCGALGAKLIFIGEAPGRLGADTSELPFHGDKSGHNFESLLEQVNLSRYDAFVTNAVLCNPKDANGNNATPTPSEIGNCSPFLREQLELVNAPIVVTLGAVALRATALLEPHSLTLSKSVRQAFAWGGRNLIPAYHPGQRAMVHRSFANQLADYQFIAEFEKRGARISPKRSVSRAKTRTSLKVGAAAHALLETSGEISYFALHKLIFLSEVRHLETTSERITDGYFVRQKDGPYCVELHAARLKDLVPDIQVRQAGGRLMLSLAQKSLLAERAPAEVLSAAERQTIKEVAVKYSRISAEELKTATYLTNPMRELLRRERVMRINLFNCPVLPRQQSTQHSEA